MFGVTSNEGEGESNAILDEFVNIQEEMYDELGLHYRYVTCTLSFALSHYLFVLE